jgi:hypothetical protein
MWIEQRLGMLPMIGDALDSDDGAGRSGPAGQRGEPTLRHMLIAAAIAGGLVALWAALLHAGAR